jgi:UrcA family protein
MTTLKTRLIGLSLAGACALAMASPTAAQSPDDQTSVRVNYADLDIDHANGARVLLNRIETAATTACGGPADIHDLGRRAMVEKCRSYAVGHAVKDLGAPMVTAAATGKTGATIVLAGR